MNHFYIMQTMSIGFSFSNSTGQGNIAGISETERRQLKRDITSGRLRKQKKDESTVNHGPQFWLTNWYEREDKVPMPSDQSSATFFASASIVLAALHLTRDQAIAENTTFEEAARHLGINLNAANDDLKLDEVA